MNLPARMLSSVFTTRIVLAASQPRSSSDRSPSSLPSRPTTCRRRTRFCCISCAAELAFVVGLAAYYFACHHPFDPQCIQGLALGVQAAMQTSESVKKPIGFNPSSTTGIAPALSHDLRSPV